MHLDASVKIWLSLHLKINNLKGEMNQYLQHLLARAKSPSKYHIMLILLKKLGEYFNCNAFFFLVTYETWTSEPILWDGVPKIITHIKLLRITIFEILMKARWPGTSLPSIRTVSRNIMATYKVSCQCIDDVLKVSHWICFMNCSFNLCIGTLWVSTFC